MIVQNGCRFCCVFSFSQLRDVEHHVTQSTAQGLTSVVGQASATVESLVTDDIQAGTQAIPQTAAGKGKHTGRVEEELQALQQR